MKRARRTARPAWNLGVARYRLVQPRSGALLYLTPEGVPLRHDYSAPQLQRLLFERNARLVAILACPGHPEWRIGKFDALGRGPVYVGLEPVATQPKRARRLRWRRPRASRPRQPQISRARGGWWAGWAARATAVSLVSAATAVMING